MTEVIGKAADPIAAAVLQEKLNGHREDGGDTDTIAEVLSVAGIVRMWLLAVGGDPESVNTSALTTLILARSDTRWARRQPQ